MTAPLYIPLPFHGHIRELSSAPNMPQAQNTTVTRAGEGHHVHEASKPSMVVKSTRGSEHSIAGVVTACPAFFGTKSHLENHPILDQGLKECPPCHPKEGTSRPLDTVRKEDP